MATATVNNKYWGWLFALGIVIVIIGILAISAPFMATFASVIALGWLLLIGGLIQLIFAFSSRATKSFLMHLIISLFSILVGILMISNPGATALTLTLLLALFFLGLGLFRIFSSIILRFENWGWYLFSGILSLILGILILVHWPSSGLWVIGLFIGIDLIFSGWTFIMGSLFMRKLPHQV